MDRFDHEVNGSTLIVVGVDGSDSSCRTAAYAAGLARRQRSLLVTVYVQPIPSAFANLGGAIFRVRWEFRTLRGDPANGLINVTDELRADAIVVGASASARHRIYGSAAVRLVRVGRRPVTVSRESIIPVPSTFLRISTSAMRKGRPSWC
ncbi:universal stress protein [Rhodococcus jostii]|uniref:Universal stress protein family protein n=1 Tax=Rhodococcus jostii TaxID=132919 RepID=A0A1H4ILR4_RHOJO|nr:universal stress protein [Rhodococcus jostii]SEB34987.1 Universal stress protein family protein [Rhodococcus jostii]